MQLSGFTPQFVVQCKLRTANLELGKRFVNVF